MAAHIYVSRIVFKSDFTNRMYLGISRRLGRSPAASVPHGDFTLGTQHSVSEIADFRQSLET